MRALGLLGSWCICSGLALRASGQPIGGPGESGNVTIVKGSDLVRLAANSSQPGVDNVPGLPPDDFGISATFNVPGAKFHSSASWIAIVRCLADIAKEDFDSPLPAFTCTRGYEINFQFKTFTGANQLRTKHAEWALLALADFWENAAHGFYAETSFDIVMDGRVLGRGSALKPATQRDGTGSGNETQSLTELGTTQQGSNANLSRIVSEMGSKHVSPSNSSSEVRLPGELTIWPQLWRWPVVKEKACEYYDLFFILFTCIIAFSMRDQEAVVWDRDGLTRYSYEFDFTFTIGHKSAPGAFPARFRVWQVIQSIEDIAWWQFRLDHSDKCWPFHGSVVDDIWLVGQFGMFKGQKAPTHLASGSEEEVAVFS